MNSKERIFLSCDYLILSNNAALSNSTACLSIPTDSFAFKIYSRVSDSPALRV